MVEMEKQIMSVNGPILLREALLKYIHFDITDSKMLSVMNNRVHSYFYTIEKKRCDNIFIYGMKYVSGGCAEQQSSNL